MVKPKDLRRTKRIVKTVQGPERLFLGPQGGKFIVVGNTAKRLGRKGKTGFSVRS